MDLIANGSGSAGEAELRPSQAATLRSDQGEDVLLVEYCGAESIRADTECACPTMQGRNTQPIILQRQTGNSEVYAKPMKG